MKTVVLVLVLLVSSVQGQHLPSEPLAEGLAGVWKSGDLSLTLGKDGTFSDKAPGATFTGKWTVTVEKVTIVRLIADKKNGEPVKKEGNELFMFVSHNNKVFSAPDARIFYDRSLKD